MKIRKLLLTGALLYQSIMSFGQATATFTVNGLAVSPQSSLQCFNNNPLVLNDQSRGNVALCNIVITDATFTNILYSTGPFNVSNSVGEIDLYNATSLPQGTTGIFGVVEEVSTGPNDPNPSKYSGLIELTSPTANPAAASFTVNNLAVSSNTTLNINGPQSLELEYKGSGDVAVYRIDIMDKDMENILYTTDYVYGPMPSTIDIWNMCANTQGSNCSSMSPSASGTFAIKLYVSSSSFSDPAASTYTGLVTINPAIPICNNPPDALFTIGNQAVSLQAITPFFNCNSLVINRTSMAPVATYKLDVLDEGLNEVLYTTGFVKGNAQKMDLLNMCSNVSGKCSSPDLSTGGTFGVRLWVSPCCSYDDVYASSYTGLISLNPQIASSPASFATTTVDNLDNQDVYTAPNTNVSSPDMVGRNSTIFYLLNQPPSKTYVGSYSLSLSSWNSSTLSWVPTGWTQNISNSNNFITPAQVPITTLGGNGFLSDTANAPDHSIWKLDATLSNPCGNYKVSTMFIIDDSTKQ